MALYYVRNPVSGEIEDVVDGLHEAISIAKSVQKAVDQHALSPDTPITPRRSPVVCVNEVRLGPKLEVDGQVGYLMTPEFVLDCLSGHVPCARMVWSTAEE